MIDCARSFKIHYAVAFISRSISMGPASRMCSRIGKEAALKSKFPASVSTFQPYKHIKTSSPSALISSTVDKKCNKADTWITHFVNKALSFSHFVRNPVKDACIGKLEEEGDFGHIPESVRSHNARTDKANPEESFVLLCARLVVQSALDAHSILKYFAGTSGV